MNWNEIEKKWQDKWNENNLFYADYDPQKPKFFIIFAYPGVSGYLHVGHMRSYTYPDVIARYKRHKGFNVLFPVGFHASGLPAVGFAQKVKEGKYDKYFKENKTPKKDIAKLTIPEYVVEFFTKIYLNDWKSLGFSVDWRRTISTIAPAYNKFMEWQFRKLKENDYLIQKPHYAPACPNCGPVAVDASETDISKGGNADVLEFTMLKFNMGDIKVVCATLRPETIFGVVNFWINPEADYCEVKVGDETWLISQSAFLKLESQGFSPKKIRDTKGSDYLGRKVKNILTNHISYMLPASFVDPNNATGVVMSVPAHAPFDHMALTDLREDPKWGELVKKLDYIPLIKTKEFGEFAAVEICERLGVENQEDHEKLDEATKELYKVEFHKGILNQNCGEYEGLRVSDVKDTIVDDLKEKGIAATLYEFSEEVICRCGRKVVIKLIPDQWFIKYSDHFWTEKSKNFVENMQINPKEYHEQFPSILDWYQDRACCRKGKWLGTKFPFDPSWIIEPISDSTLYPAVYLFSLYVNNNLIKAEQLNDDFFDFIYLEKGDVKQVAKSTTIKEDMLLKIQKDVQYWYPLDLNCGGKEHKSVHFPVFYMNHTGILPNKYWPRGIFVNWWVTGKGGKLSKSKGGAPPLENTILDFSADSLRLYYCLIASPHTDIEWNSEQLKSYLQLIKSIFNNISSAKDSIDKEPSNKWLLKYFISAFNNKIKEATDYLEDLVLNKGAQIIFYDLYNLLMSYKSHGGNITPEIISLFKKWIVMMMPFTPHIGEELWELYGEDGFATLAFWPESKSEDINDEIEFQYEILEDFISDCRNVLKLVTKNNEAEYSKLIVYTAETWKWDLLQVLADNQGDFKKTMDYSKNNKDLIKYMKSVASYIKDINKRMMWNNKRLLKYRLDEADLLKVFENYIKEQFNLDLVINPKEDPKNKAKFAIPGRPAFSIV